MQVHRAGVAHVVRFPHPLIDGLPEQGHVLVLEEQHQQVVFLPGQGDGHPGLGDQHGLGVHRHVPQGIDGAALARPAEHRLHPGDQLHDLKGLHQIVVRPGPQALHPVLHAALGGDEDHRGAGGLDLPQQLIAVDAGQHDVQQHQVIAVLHDEIRSRVAVIGPGALIAAGAQVPVDQIRNGPLVLYDQYLCHVCSPVFPFRAIPCCPLGGGAPRSESRWQ